MFKCNLCASDAYFFSLCPKFPTVECKLRQCKERKLCQFCASPRHLTTDCRGNRGELLPSKICGKDNHYWSLCPEKDEASSPSLSVSSACSDKELLLPHIRVTVTRSGKRCTLNCLLDSDSQWSHLSDEVAKRIRIKIDFACHETQRENTRYLKESLIIIYVVDNSLPIKALFNCNIYQNLPISRLAEEFQGNRV